jgi:predicted AAA+ superfamily ATPase
MKYEGLNDVRKSTSLELAKFLTPLKKGSGLCYLRGRRRVGKSTILQDFHQRKEFRLYYFSGILDESNLDTLRRFTKSWAQYSENTLLDKIRDKELNWDLIFQDIVQFAKTNTVHIALDEIQWIAKNQSGFIGTLKNHWLSLEATKNCRIIICGSSNKFFKNFTGGEEQILRGLKTRSDIVLPPFSLSEIHQKYGKNLKQEQTALLYMLLGGIPYYWNQLDFEKNFIQLLNQAFAESSTIFLEEVDEILRLEFNQAGVKTIKKILKTLGLRGAPPCHNSKENKITNRNPG